MATTNLFATQDCFVDMSSSSTNYNTTLLSVWRHNGFHRRFFIQFDVSIPAATSITSAVMYLYQASVQNGAITCPTYKITSSWTETGPTWNSQPTLNTGTNLGNITFPNPTVGWRTLDITSIFTSWWNGTVSNYGVCIYDGADSSIGANIASRSYGTTEYRPYISVEYEGAPSTAFFAFFCEAWERRGKLWRNNKLILPKDLGFSY